MSERRADARKSFYRSHRRRLARSPGGRRSLPPLWGGGLFRFIRSHISHSRQAREWRLERERERETQTSRGEEILGFVSIKQHFCVVTLDDIRGGRQQRTAFADLTKHFQTHIRICSTWQELRLSSLTPWELQWRHTPMVNMTYLAWKSIREVWI